jgi:hypothetical protein
MPSLFLVCNNAQCLSVRSVGDRGCRGHIMPLVASTGNRPYLNSTIRFSYYAAFLEMDSFAIFKIVRVQKDGERS